MQLDLFAPHEDGYAFKVIVTNRRIKAKQVLVYHNGRRAPLWEFDELETTRRNLIQKAGHLTEPQRRLTLTMSADTKVKQQLTHYLDCLQKAA